jgi:hypothetical protein
MKAPRIVWPALMIVTGLTGWLHCGLTMPPAKQARIGVQVENDVRDDAAASGCAGSRNCGSHDPYFSGTTAPGFLSPRANRGETALNFLNQPKTQNKTI